MATKLSVSHQSTKTKRNVAPATETIPMGKRCSHCLKVKPLSEYSKNSNTKDGYEAKCKECTQHYFANWYENNRDRVAETNRAWRKAHPNKVRSYHEADRERKRAKGVSHDHN